MTQRFDLTVVGGGPGGYVAAIRAAQLGKTVALVEKAELGGVCLNWGCIPTKALLNSADTLKAIEHALDHGIKVGRVEVEFAKVIRRSRKIARRLSNGVGYLMKKNEITVLEGEGRLVKPGEVSVTSSDGSTETVTSQFVILALGARARELPGISLETDRVITSREALVLKEAPKSMAVIGSGAIGVEMAHLYQTFGTQVHLFELLPTLVPAADADVGKELGRAFKKRRMKVHTNTQVTALKKVSDGLTLEYAKGEKTASVTVEKVLVAVGVQPNTENQGLEEAGVALERAWIQVDDMYRTSVDGVYAIGDVIGEPCLAHAASAEGVVAVEHMFGLEVAPIDPLSIPGCIYCHPQVASVGYTEAGAIEAGFDVKVGKFPLSANGKALAMGEGQGFVKVIVDAKYGEMLGAHIIGPEATELITEIALARTGELTYREVLRTIHPHPTLSEAIMEAVADAFDEALNI